MHFCFQVTSLDLQKICIPPWLCSRIYWINCNKCPKYSSSRYHSYMCSHICSLFTKNIFLLILKIQLRNTLATLKVDKAIAFDDIQVILVSCQLDNFKMQQRTRALTLQSSDKSLQMNCVRWITSMITRRIIKH